VLLGTAAAIGSLEMIMAAVSFVPLSIWIALFILTGMGFSMTTTMAMANSLVQTVAPDALRGRVMSVYMTVFGGTAPFGALFAGATSRAFGTPASLAIGGTIALTATGIIALRSGALPQPRLRLHPAALPTIPRSDAAPGVSSGSATPPRTVTSSHDD
jgi:MFS family permease